MKLLKQTRICHCWIRARFPLWIFVSIQGILKCVQNTTVQGLEKGIHCRLLNTIPPCPAHVRNAWSASCWKMGRYTREVSACSILTFFPRYWLSQLVETKYWTWSTFGIIKWTLLWSNSFLIFRHIITPWNLSCKVLTGGEELRTKIHQTFPSEFVLGNLFHYYLCPSSWSRQ